MSLASNINIRIPFELGWDIWNRYYTYVVLDELLRTPAAIQARLFSMPLASDYIYLTPDERQSWRPFDEVASFSDYNSDLLANRKRYHRLELR